LTKSRNDKGFSLAELAAAIGGTVEGDSQVVVYELAPIENAEPGSISFVANDRYFKHIKTTRATALILAPSVPCPHLPVLRHVNPYLAFARVSNMLYPDTRKVPVGIDPTAVVSPQAEVDPTAGIGPLCHIESGAVIGKDCQLVSSVYVGENTHVGDSCLFYPGVKIMHECTVGDRVILHPGVVIGGDGFGYAASEHGAYKIKQVGWVELGNDVEVGANTTIDRGAIGPTRVGNRTKIDNLVQLGHNVQIGQDCILVAAVAIGGSTRLGDRVTVGGMVAIAGHLDVGDDVSIAACSGVFKPLEAGKTYYGTPAREAMKAKRAEAQVARLAKLVERVKHLEERLKTTEPES
jgi:UDP-3-O-[3-hydroxymyristoyl] glucosamine N-acyltransferase